MSTSFKRFKKTWLPAAMLGFGAPTSPHAAAGFKEGGKDAGLLKPQQEYGHTT